MSEHLESAEEWFLVHKRALGRKYHSEERELRLLVRFAGQHGVSCPSALTMSCWRPHRSGPAWAEAAR